MIDFVRCLRIDFDYLATATLAFQGKVSVTEDNNTVELATELTIAWLGNPNTRTAADDVPAFLKSMHAAVSGLTSQAAPEAEAEPAQEFTPAVSVRKSLASPDYIISMIDGKPYKTLRRHLSTNGLTPEQYRERYGLKSDYPMVATNYSESRRAMAHKIGLGRKAGQSASGDSAPANEEETATPAAADASPASPPARKAPRASKKAAQQPSGDNA